MLNYKRIIFICGGEEGFGWMLTLGISEKTKIFAGHFTITDESQNQRRKTRVKDREFLKARLGEKYMADKVLDHSWIENSAEYRKVVLLHKSEHNNGGMDVLRDKALWIAKEDWL